MFLTIINISSCLPKEETYDPGDLIPEYYFTIDYTSEIKGNSWVFNFTDLIFAIDYDGCEPEENVYYCIISFETDMDEKAFKACIEPSFSNGIDVSLLKKDFSSKKIIFKCVDNEGVFKEKDCSLISLCSKEEKDFHFCFNPYFDGDGAHYRYVNFYLKYND